MKSSHGFTSSEGSKSSSVMHRDVTASRPAVGIPTKPLPEVWARHLLTARTQDAVRQMRRTLNGATTRDNSLLKQFARGDYLTGVYRLLEVGLKCDDPTDATAFPEALRGFAIEHHPKAHTDWVEAFGAETHANGLANDAQHDFWKEPTPTNLDRAIEALNRQLVETHRSLMALHRARQVNRGLRA